MPDPAAEPREDIVWQWDFRRDRYDVMSEPEQQLMTDFLKAHGIDPMAFLEGNSLRVVARGNGTLWLDTWRAVGNDARTAPACPHCPGCVKRERVVTQLAGPVPLVGGGGYLSKTAEVPTVRAPEAEPSGPAPAIPVYVGVGDCAPVCIGTVDQQDALPQLLREAANNYVRVPEWDSSGDPV